MNIRLCILLLTNRPPSNIEALMQGAGTSFLQHVGARKVIVESVPSSASCRVHGSAVYRVARLRTGCACNDGPGHEHDCGWWHDHVASVRAGPAGLAAQRGKNSHLVP